MPQAVTKSIISPLTKHRVFIHAGFDGTGQSTLQRQFLSVHPDILCLGKPVSETLNKELRKSEISFDEDRIRALMASLTDGGSEDKLWILSDDNFTNYPPTIGLLAMRLRAMYPNARVFFTIRNQINLITSWYAQGGNISRAPKPFVGRHVSFDNFLDFEFGNYEESMMHSLEFEKVIRVYEDLFGAENVKVFVFENFISDKAAYLSDICRYIDVDPVPAAETFYGGHEKVRPSAANHYYRIARNHLLPGISIRNVIPGGTYLRQSLETLLKRGRPARITMPEAWRARLSEIYAPGNRRLSQRYNLSLEKLGYPT